VDEMSTSFFCGNVLRKNPTFSSPGLCRVAGRRSGLKAAYSSRARIPDEESAARSGASAEGGVQQSKCVDFPAQQRREVDAVHSEAIFVSNGVADYPLACCGHPSVAGGHKLPAMSVGGVVTSA
jgi:hypothetical protein